MSNFFTIISLMNREEKKINIQNFGKFATNISEKKIKNIFL